MKKTTTQKSSFMKSVSKIGLYLWAACSFILMFSLIDVLPFWFISLLNFVVACWCVEKLVKNTDGTL